MRHFWLLLLAFWIGAGPSGLLRTRAEESGLVLVDVTSQSGIDFVHRDGSQGKEYLFELMGAGLATLDFDGDGNFDSYFLNGQTMPSSGDASPTPGNALFRNLGHMHFTECSHASRADFHGYGLGVTVGDYNSDGFPDLYISNFGQNALLQNCGDGTFLNVADIASVTDGNKFGAGVAFLDLEGDGDLDLFSANYVDFTFERHAVLAPQAFPFPPGPKDFPPLTDSLFLNNGDGTFSDISVDSGIASVRGPSMGVICGDFDNDGDTDIFVCCDGAPNHYFRNEGMGRFVEQGVLVGVAYDAMGQANGSMGVDAMDLNGDHVDDLLITDYANQLPMLFLSLGPQGYSDDTRRSQAGREVLPHVNWGVGLIDFDNDVDGDIFLCNGHFLKRAREINPQTDFRVANTLLENMGNCRFTSRTESGLQGQSIQSSRGAAFDDLDNDGDVDVVILNCADAASVLENRSLSKSNHWMQMELIGRNCNRDALGARVTIQFGDTETIAEVRSGRGYQSHFGSRLHFGLGDATSIEQLTISWPDGSRQQFLDVAADQLLRVVQAPK